MIITQRIDVGATNPDILIGLIKTDTGLKPTDAEIVFGAVQSITYQHSGGGAATSVTPIGTVGSGYFRAQSLNAATGTGVALLTLPSAAVTLKGHVQVTVVMTAASDIAVQGEGTRLISIAPEFNLHTDGTAKVGVIDAGVITATSIAANAITSTQLADDAITAAKIEDNAITAAKIATNAITSTQLADNAITVAKIADNAITNLKIADGAIAAGKVGADAIPVGGIADGAITASTLADNTITSVKIATASLTSTHFGADCFTAANFADGAFVSANFDLSVYSSMAAQVWDTDLITSVTVGSMRENIINNLDASVSSRSVYAGGDTSGVTTLLTRISTARAGYIDKLNVTGVLAHVDNAGTFKATGFSTHSAGDVQTGLATTENITALNDFDPSTDLVGLKNIDGKNWEVMFAKMAAMVGGKVTKSGDVYTPYRLDGITTLGTVTVTDVAGVRTGTVI